MAGAFPERPEGAEQAAPLHRAERLALARYGLGLPAVDDDSGGKGYP